MYGQFITAYFFFYMKNGSFHSDLLAIFGLISLTAVIFLYPLEEKISIRQRLYAFFISVVIFVGTNVIQMLKWTPVGDVFNIQGVQIRYNRLPPVLLTMTPH